MSREGCNVRIEILKVRLEVIPVSGLVPRQGLPEMLQSARDIAQDGFHLLIRRESTAVGNVLIFLQEFSDVLVFPSRKVWGFRGTRRWQSSRTSACRCRTRHGAGRWTRMGTRVLWCRQRRARGKARWRRGRWTRLLDTRTWLCCARSGNKRRQELN